MNNSFLKWVLKVIIIGLITSISFIAPLASRIECQVQQYQLRQEQLYNARLIAKGKALSEFMDIQYGIQVPPEQAQFLQVNMNQWDIEIKDLDVFGSWNNK